MCEQTSDKAQSPLIKPGIELVPIPNYPQLAPKKNINRYKVGKPFTIAFSW